jgi:tRNA 2-thiocytidine biosynthesis protein TtcA
MEPELQNTLNGLQGLMAKSLARRGLTGPPPAPHERLAEMDLDKLERRLMRAMGRAIGDFHMIADGDRILVAISGGKDSWAMLHLLNEMRKKAPVKFDLVAVNIDQGYAGFRQDIVENYVDTHGFEFHMEYFDIASILEEKAAGDTPCSLCSRLRRGALYGLAEKHRCNKIALGHHLDDFVETLLLNTLFIGRLSSMAPKLISDDGKHVVIRPLVYATEKEISAFVQRKQMPIVCCQCPLMCGEVVHGDFKRRMVKKMIDTLEQGIPNVRQSLLASLGNVKPSHLLDTTLWDFK